MKTLTEKLIFHLLAFLASVTLAALLLAIPADEARAHDDTSATLHAETYPLHKAVKADDLDSVNHFITVHMANVNARTKESIRDEYEDIYTPLFMGYTPLDIAARLGHASAISMLIVAGADVNARMGDAVLDSGYTPLHLAVHYSGNASAISMLIVAGADVSADVWGPRHTRGYTPLHLAADLGRASVMPMLIAAGADVNAPVKSEEKRNHRPLHLAVSQTPSEGLLRSKFWGLVMEDVDYYSAISILIVAGARMNDSGPSVVPPLHQALSNAYVVSILIAAGAKVNAIDESNGNTALHRVAQRPITLRINWGKDYDEGDVGLVSLLLDKGANPNIPNFRGWRPLDLAYHGGNANTWQARRNMMAALINGGANWSDECSGGAIPNKHYRGEAQVAIYPECVCPLHISERNSHGACE